MPRSPSRKVGDAIDANTINVDTNPHVGWAKQVRPAMAAEMIEQGTCFAPT